MQEEISDFLGNPVKLGSEVARAVIYLRSPKIVKQIVTRIEDGKVYLDNSPIALRYTDRMIVIDNL